MSQMQLDRDFAALPERLRVALRPALRAAARPIKADMQRRASWSSRIPAAIEQKDILTTARPMVALTVNHVKAPHARAYEFGSSRGSARLRHPVYGHRDRWVSERTRPFFFPAFAAGIDRAVQEIGDAVARAVR